MKIKVNGKDQCIEPGISILSFLRLKGIEPNSVVVEHNYELPEKERWGDIILKENDNLEILKFIGGG